MKDQKVAIITGGNRGIGFEIARQLYAKDFKLVITSRNVINALEASNEIGEGIFPLELDLTSADNISEFSDVIIDSFPYVDVLINNAGIMGKEPILDFNMDEIKVVMETNCFGALELTKALFPMLNESDDARVINISSGMGDLHSMQQGGYAAYKLSKWAMNGMTMLLAAELEGTNISVNAMCPGWVKSDMGGANAPREVSQGADTAVWLATTNEKHNGKFFRDREEISW